MKKFCYKKKKLCNKKKCVQKIFCTEQKKSVLNKKILYRTKKFCTEQKNSVRKKVNRVKTGNFSLCVWSTCFCRGIKAEHFPPGVSFTMTPQGTLPPMESTPSSPDEILTLLMIALFVSMLLGVVLAICDSYCNRNKGIGRPASADGV